MSLANMNISSLIKEKYRFLTENGFSYVHIQEKRLFDEFRFTKSDYSVLISCDCRHEYLDITVKDGTKTLFQTSGDSVVVNYREENNYPFLLKEIYSLPHSTFSLSQEQFVKLTELYADILKKWGFWHEENKTD